MRFFASKTSAWISSEQRTTRGNRSVLSIILNQLQICFVPRFFLVLDDALFEGERRTFTITPSKWWVNYPHPTEWCITRVVRASSRIWEPVFPDSSSQTFQSFLLGATWISNKSLRVKRKPRNIFKILSQESIHIHPCCGGSAILRK